MAFAGGREERDVELAAPRTDVQQALVTIRRNLTLILLVTAIGFVSAFFFMKSRGETYQANAKVVLEAGPTAVTEILQVLGRLQLNRLVIATQTDILSSRALLGKVADRLALIEDPRYNKTLREPGAVAGAIGAVTSIFGGGDDDSNLAEPGVQRELVIDELVSSISVSREGESLALTVTAYASDPRTAAALANMVTTVYLEDLAAERRAEIEAAVSILRERASELTERIATLEQQLADQIREQRLDDLAYDGQLRAQIAALSARAAVAPESNERERAIKAQLMEETAQLEEELRVRTLASVQRGQLERELETDRSRYQLVVERLTSLDTATDTMQATARLLSSAEPPAGTSGLSPVTAGLFGAIVFSVFSIVGVFIVSAVDVRIREPEQVEAALGAPCLASVPELRARRSAAVSASSLPHERMRTTPQSGFSEAIRRLFLQVASGLDLNRSNVIGVTSSMPNEGKSTLSLCLAVAARPRFRRIALVDLDLRRHGLASALMAAAGVDERSSRRDLRAWFEGRVELEQVACTFDTLPGIDVFPAMYVEGDLSAVLTSDNLNLLFDFLRENYDFVIVDTPPALPVSDIELIAPCVDGLVVAVGWERITHGALQETGKILEQVNAPLIGAALNRINPKKHWKAGRGNLNEYYKYYTVEA